MPWDQVQAARQHIRLQNQQGGHPQCTGCAHLVPFPEAAREQRLRWLGISHGLACNLACAYCSLQAPRSESGSASTRPRPTAYDVGETVEELISHERLATDAIIDWGGGGEPLLLPEFDRVVRRLDRHGTTQWLHTNGTVVPYALRGEVVDHSRVHVVCSVDAGSPEAYHRLKRRDVYRQVWANLKTFQSSGIEVFAKYIMMPENSSREEIEAFVREAANSGKPVIVGDVDARCKEVGDEMVRGLAWLRIAAKRAGLRYQLRGLCSHSASFGELRARVDRQVLRRCLKELPGRFRCWIVLKG